MRVLLLAVQVGGCSAASSARPPEPPRSEFNDPEPFRLSLTAAGSFRPGEPVQLTLRATSAYPSSEGEVRLVLTEVAAGEDCRWGPDIRIPLNEVVRSHILVRKPLVAGEPVEESVTITIPEPGYYTVTAAGYRPPEPPMVGNAAARHYGLLIAPRGGRLTEGFDESLFPPGMRAYPGPFTPETSPPRIRIVDAGQGCVAGTPA